MSFVDPSNRKSANHQNWYAVKVRSRGEKTVADVLRNKQYEVLTPSYLQIRQYSDRTRKVDCALFPGYVFVRLFPEIMLGLLSTAGVSYVVQKGSNFEPLSQEEVDVIQALCHIDMRLKENCEPCAYPQVGRRVRIKDGPLVGIEGVIIRTGNKDRVVVTVDSLSSSVSVEIEHTRIESL